MNKFMKKELLIRQISIILAIIFALSVTGCGETKAQQNADEVALHGEWAYAHDENKTVAKFSEDGSAKLEGVKYQYSCEDGYILLTDKEGKVKKMRYATEGDQMYLYVQSTYMRQPEGGDSGIVGLWRSSEGWTFEFTNKGTFMEDGVLTGYYQVDETEKAIKLMYGEALSDTLFFYELTGDELFVEYPWLMIKR